MEQGGGAGFRGTPLLTLRNRERRWSRGVQRDTIAHFEGGGAGGGAGFRGTPLLTLREVEQGEGLGSEGHHCSP